MSRYKTAGTIGGVVLAVYFLVLPMFWSSSDPNVTVTMPANWRHDVDVPIHVRVSHINPNFIVREIRVVFDYAPGDGQGTPYPRILHQVTEKKEWTVWKLNRFTFPCSKKLDVMLPLAELARDSGVKPGVLKGEVQVTVDYAPSAIRGNSFLGSMLSRERRVATPYELTLE